MKPLERCRAYGLGALLAVATIAGCSTFKSKSMPVDSSAGLFDKARLSYEVDTDRVNSQLRSPEGELVSYTPRPGGHLPANSRANIEVRYPHPDKREGYAQVQVRIETHAAEKPTEAPAWQRWWLATRETIPGLSDGRTQEVWTLDIPKSELALLINRLDSTGYFGSYEKAEGTKIHTELDGSSISKSWHQIPEIDALVIRVRTEGRLTSSTKAAAEPLAAKEPSSNVAVYRALLAGDKRPAQQTTTPREEGVAIASDQAIGSQVTPVQHVEIVRLPAVSTRRR